MPLTKEQTYQHYRVDVNEFNHYRIEISEDNYAFILNNEPPVYIKRGNTCERGVYYMLWPYFGGHIPAPHDIVIKIRMISS